MDQEKNVCQVLLEEYELLRQRVEALELGPNVTLRDLEELGVTRADLERIKELEKEIDSKCQDQFPKYQRIDLGPGLDNGYFSSLN